jgi:hypothetical protein
MMASLATHVHFDICNVIGLCDLSFYVFIHIASGFCLDRRTFLVHKTPEIDKGKSYL